MVPEFFCKQAGAGVTSASEAASQAGLLSMDLSDNADRVRNLASVAERLADRLAGSQPESSGAGTDKQSANGFLDEMRSLAAIQSRDIYRISEALSRMEKALG